MQPVALKWAVIYDMCLSTVPIDPDLLPAIALPRGSLLPESIYIFTYHTHFDLEQRDDIFPRNACPHPHVAKTQKQIEDEK
jgi:hypothetical protein